MRLDFTKMNGAGNDFILVDNREQKIRLTPKRVVRLCHRQRGIGADGILLVVPSSSRQADWAWEFFNSDGSTADMCGNGARCFARFVQKLTGAAGDISFQTGAGIIRASFSGDRVTVNLTSPKGLRLHQAVELDRGTHIIHSLNTGVPHAVLFVPNADRAMVDRLGPEIRFHKHFAPAGTNVNFVEVFRPNTIRVRTYERGVEGETLACGTGVTASALIAALLNDFVSPVKVHVQGGDLLEVGFKREKRRFRDVLLTGPAEFVFEGSMTV
jgi:diaminopimelate epimerase